MISTSEPLLSSEICQHGCFPPRPNHQLPDNTSIHSIFDCFKGFTPKESHNWRFSCLARKLELSHRARGGQQQVCVGHLLGV
jgi:hypothetical protein